MFGVFLYLELCSHLMMLQNRVTTISNIGFWFWVVFFFQLPSQKSYVNVIRRVHNIITRSNYYNRQLLQGVQERFGVFFLLFFSLPPDKTKKKIPMNQTKQIFPEFSCECSKTLCFTERACKSSCSTKELVRQQN